MVSRRKATKAGNTRSNSACSAEVKYQYEGSFASNVHSAKMPSRGASMFVQFVGGFRDPATSFKSLVEIASGVVEPIIAPCLSNSKPMQTAGSGKRCPVNRAEAACQLHKDFKVSLVNNRSESPTLIPSPGGEGCSA